MDEQQRKGIGRQISEARELRGWSPDRLAEEADLSVKTVRKLEIGEVTRPGSLGKVRDALGLEPEAERTDREMDSVDVHAFIETVRYVLNTIPEEERKEATLRAIRALWDKNGTA